jgi:hypothetical protein
MDEAARKYAETHNEKYKDELFEVSPRTNGVNDALNVITQLRFDPIHGKGAFAPPARDAK